MTQTQLHDPARRTGWIGWVFLAATILLVGATIRIFYGIMAMIGPNAAYSIAGSARRRRSKRSVGAGGR